MLVYLITLISAMCLIILPLPTLMNSMNPDWVLLIIIYWVLTMPERVGVFNGLIVGIFVDVLSGRLLGQNALIYALISYVCLKFHKRLRQYPIPQQSLFVFLCLLFSQMLTFWMENIQSLTELSFVFLLPVVVGTAFWPLVYSLLQIIGITRRFG